VVRRAVRLNDELPGEKPASSASAAHWVWQRGPCGKSVYAVVAQLAVRKPVLTKKLEAFDPQTRMQPDPVCGAPEWRREPLRVTFRPAGREPASFEVVPGSAMLVEDSGDEPDPAATPPKPL